LYASSSCSIRTLSLPAALPILAKNTLDAGDFGYGLLYGAIGVGLVGGSFWSSALVDRIGIARAYGIALAVGACDADPVDERAARSEEHTSELQSRGQLVCRLLL